MKQGETVELEIPSSPEYVAIVRQAIEGIARRMRFEDRQIEDLKVAVGEACTNAVKYGNGPGQVAIRCMVVPDGLSVEIRNNVVGSVSPCIPDTPDTTKEGGLGLYLIRQLMDEVDLLWNCNTATITMFKRLDTQQVA